MHVFCVLYGLFDWQGLGKKEQGSTEHIKVKVKNNTLGLGTTVSNEVRNHSFLSIHISIYCVFYPDSNGVVCVLRTTGLPTRMILTSSLLILTAVTGRTTLKVRSLLLLFSISLQHKVFTNCFRYYNYYGLILQHFNVLMLIVFTRWCCNDIYGGKS